MGRKPTLSSSTSNDGFHPEPAIDLPELSADLESFSTKLRET
jgi:hypothetical protein